MNINLNNYESFFLMYVDNELSAADKLLVEAFVKDFPYLNEELDLLKKMILPANEAVVFEKKNLYRSAVTDNHLQETMLLHLDDELAEPVKHSFLQQLQTNKPLAQNWALLQRTKLDAGEIISFPGKSILYRKEEGRLVRMNWVRWAVAAVFIAAAFFTGISILEKTTEAPAEIAVVNPGNKNQEDSLNIAGAANEEAKNNEKDLSATIAKSTPVQLNTEFKNPANAVSSQKKKDISRQIQAVEPRQTDKAVLATSIQNKKQLPIEKIAQGAQDEMAVKTERTNLKIQEIIHAEMNTASVTGKHKPAILNGFTNNQINPVTNPFAKSTLVQTDEQNDNRIFLMDEEDVAHSKAGILFKKLKRTVARTAKIKTGNSLKIAGFEFAVK
jgi:hypothetical protein